MTDRSPLFRVFNEIGIIAQLSQTRFEAVMPPGMTLAQFTVLNHFVRLGGPKSPLALARAFQVTKATMSSTLARLEGKGLVSLVRDPKDGRGKLVDITDKGRMMRETCVAAVGPAMHGLTADGAMPDLEALLPQLVVLREVLDRARNTET